MMFFNLMFIMMRKKMIRKIADITTFTSTLILGIFFFIFIFWSISKIPSKNGECIHPDWPSYVVPTSHVSSGEHVISSRGYQIGITGTYEKTGEPCYRWRNGVSKEVYDYRMGE